MSSFDSEISLGISDCACKTAGCVIRQWWCDKSWFNQTSGENLRAARHDAARCGSGKIARKTTVKPSKTDLTKRVCDILSARESQWNSKNFRSLKRLQCFPVGPNGIREATPAKLRLWKNSCLRRPKNPSAAALSGEQPFALIERVRPCSLQMRIHSGHR